MRDRLKELPREDQDLLEFIEYFPVVLSRPEFQDRLEGISGKLKELAQGADKESLSAPTVFRIISGCPTLLKAHQYDCARFAWLLNELVFIIKVRNMNPPPRKGKGTKKASLSFTIGHKPKGTRDYLRTWHLVKIYEAQGKQRTEAIKKIAEGRCYKSIDDAKRSVRRHIRLAEAFMRKLGIQYELPEGWIKDLPEGWVEEWEKATELEKNKEDCPK